MPLLSLDYDQKKAVKQALCNCASFQAGDSSILLPGCFMNADRSAKGVQGNKYFSRSGHR